MKIKCL